VTGAPEPTHHEPAGEPDVWRLDDVLAHIAVANPTLAAAEARVAEARAALDAARARALPELGLAVGYLETDSPMQAFGLLLEQEKLDLAAGFDPTPGRTTNWHGEARLDWMLFQPGRTEGRRAASSGADAAAIEREAIERRLLNAGVRAYLGLGAARDLEDVAAASVAVVDARLAEVRVREREGAALRADVLRLEVRLAQARDGAARARLVARQAEAALNRLLGRPADSALALVREEVAIGTELPGALGPLLDLAARERLDLRAAAARVRSAHELGAGARAAWLPTLSAFGVYDVDGAHLGTLLDQDSYAAGAQLGWRLSGRTRPEIRRAEARERQVRAAEQELALDVEREVRDAFDALAAARETRALSEAAVAAAEEAYRMVAAAQDAGGATTTDVLEAEEAQRDARVRRVAARAAVDVARARLVAATGGVL
jgi:outer membrane protein TolC